MHQLSETHDGNGMSIKVGTTGTIGSLMLQELESMEHNPPPNKKQQSAPVSVPYRVTPKKSLERKNSLLEPGNSNCESGSSITESSHQRNAERVSKPRYSSRMKGSRAPILISDDITMDRNTKGDRNDKKVQSYIVEVVDLKCNNPMSNRLKKLGFSKLSESIM